VLIAIQTPFANEKWGVNEKKGLYYFARRKPPPPKGRNGIDGNGMLDKNEQIKELGQWVTKRHQTEKLKRERERRGKNEGRKGKESQKQ
jgi:hypothetical protein